jgi:predicted DNA-binding protein (MmcQ/YjbR family)
VSEPGDVAPEILERLRPICRGLPETVEELAWIGLRWRIRKRTFAHVYTVDPARHRVYARTTGSREPVCVLTFRSPPEDLAGLVAGGHPFFKAAWGTDVVALVLDGEVDWDEVAELLVESYRVLAPKRLAALVGRD